LTTPAIIDAIAIAVLAGLAALGAWKGLLRTLAGLLVVVLSLAGAGIIASALSGPAAKLIAPAIEKRIEARLDEALLEQRPGVMPGSEDKEELPLAELLDLLGVDQARRETLTDHARETVRETGASLAAAVVESLARSALYGILYMLSFILLSVGLHLLVRMLDMVLKLPGLHGLNVWGGALVGLAEGVLLLFLAVWVLRLVGVSFDGEDGGAVFRFFTTHTPLDVLKFLDV